MKRCRRRLLCHLCCWCCWLTARRCGDDKLLGRRYSLSDRRQTVDLSTAGRCSDRQRRCAGSLCALMVTTAVAPVVGLAWQIGLLVGGLAMVGDLFSSFLKRRLGRSSSTPLVGIDQIPESLFPLLACIAPIVADRCRYCARRCDIFCWRAGGVARALRASICATGPISIGSVIQRPPATRAA